MSKVASASLFELVRSLSQTEKRYFKLHLLKQVKGDSRLYARLFDSIDRQKTYDESKLSSFPHLAVMKVRLEEHLMWSLRNFHSSKSITEKLRHDIRSVELLFQKRLFEHAKKQIARSKKTAEHYEEFLSLFQLIKWELRIINAQAFSSVSEDELKKIYGQAEDCLEKIKNAHQYALLSDSVYLRMRKSGFFRNQADFKKFAQMLKQPLLRSEEKALSLEAKYYFHSTLIGFAELQSKYHDAHEHNLEILQLLEKNPQHIEKDPYKYLSMQQNLVVWQYQLKEYDQALVSLEKLKQFIIQQRTSISENLFSRIFFYINTVSMLVYARQGEYEAGVKALPVFRKEFEKYRIHPLNKETEWMFGDAVAAVHFGSGNFSEAIRWYNKIINDKEGDVRNDMQALTRIMSLIAHYELGNQDLLRYMVKWTYRYLIKRNRLYTFETIILNFIGKKSLHMNTRKETIAAFTELKTDLEKLLPDKFQRRPLDDFEYISWLQSKIESRPLAKIVAEKAGRL